MNLDEFMQELDNIGELTDGQIREKLEFLVNTPMTSEAYHLAFHGIFLLMHKCGATEQNERFRDAAYRKVIKMLEGEPDPTDSEAIRLQNDYATALLSHFMDPLVPKAYASQLKEAAKIFYQRTGREDKLVKEYIDKL